MKQTKNKKLNREINTICDFSTPVHSQHVQGDYDPSGTDPSNRTIITLTTVFTRGQR